MEEETQLIGWNDIRKEYYMEKKIRSHNVHVTREIVTPEIVDAFQTK